MADPIPAADADLLKAQAQSGQAGVDAYKQGQRDLEAQKASAVQQAMQEAALRGAPVGAVPAIQSTITQPYDQGIAAMTQGSANFQAHMAESDRFMQDYMAAANATRSYIPAEAEAKAAPIRAQMEFELRQLELQGRSRVDEIRANTDLELARMDAEERRRKAQEAKDAAKAAKLTQGQLKGLLPPGVADLLSTGSSAVQAILAGNERQKQTTGMAAVSKSRLSSADETAAAKAAAAANSARYDAAYGGRGLAQQKAYDFAKSAGNAFTAAENRQPLDTPAAPVRRAGDVIAHTPTGVPIIANSASSYYNAAVPRPLNAAQQQAARIAAMKAKPSAATSRLQQGYDQTRQRSQAATAGSGQFGLQRLLAPMNAPLQEARDVQAQYNLDVPGTGNRLGISAEQLAGLDPIERAILLGGASEGSIMNPQDFQALAVGEPNARMAEGLPSYTGSGSHDAVRAAFELAAEQLQAQGYDISPEDLANAMPDKVPSIYDYLAGTNDGPSSEQVYSSAAQAQAADEKAQTADDKAAQKQSAESAQREIIARYGHKLPGELGDPGGFLNVVDDKGTQPDLQTMSDTIADTIDQWDTSKHGEPTFQKVMQSVKATFSQQGVHFEPLLFQYAMFMNGQ